MATTRPSEQTSEARASGLPSLPFSSLLYRKARSGPIRTSPKNGKTSPNEKGQLGGWSSSCESGMFSSFFGVEVLQDENVPQERKDELTPVESLVRFEKPPDSPVVLGLWRRGRH